ncbi:MAG: hypothetical protein DRN65_01610 [Thaumarchaeota archaeon]|nr:MAG: hypothetical protein DRN47_02125 [Candidatus Wolframiiraptor sp.]RLG08403.1 MAG: hypothetical protein DRN65_01610 [Nitrososphaerota archaeon]HDD40409.1 hypothetical protein [Nitrososphaeria archaeon]
MGLWKNLGSVLCLLTIVWATFLVVSYITAVTIFYTLEYSQATVFMSVLRVLIGLAIAGGWIAIWYNLTKFWLYRILLKKEET